MCFFILSLLYFVSQSLGHDFVQIKSYHICSSQPGTFFLASPSLSAHFPCFQAQCFQSEITMKMKHVMQLQFFVQQNKLEKMTPTHTHTSPLLFQQENVDMFYRFFLFFIFLFSNIKGIFSDKRCKKIHFDNSESALYIREDACNTECKNSQQEIHDRKT